MDSRHTTIDGPNCDLLRALERERGEIAAALRSDSAQVMATVLVGLAALAECDDLETIHAGVEELRSSVRAGLQRVQALASEIRPSVLDDFGLAAAVESLARTLRAEGPTIETAVPGEHVRLAPDDQALVYRTLEEAMRNAVQHAGAQRIQVELTPHAGELQFAVEDDGHGFDLAATADGSDAPSGMLLMRARAGALGGSLDVESKQGHGTRVVLHVPRERNQ